MSLFPALFGIFRKNVIHSFLKYIVRSSFPNFVLSEMNRGKWTIRLMNLPMGVCHKSFKVTYEGA